MFVLAVAVAALGYTAYTQNASLKDHQRRIKELTTKFDSRSKSDSLKLQEQCARQAATVFKSDGWEKEQMAGFEDHYNGKMNRCFIIEENTDVKTTPGRVSHSKTMFDAFERKNLANYFWRSDKTKKYWEVAPFQCDVMMPSGEKRTCRSSDEFDDLIKVYMQ